MEATDFQVPADHPVAGGGGSEGIAPQCLADRPGGAATQMAGKQSIGRDLATRDAPDRLINPGLKISGISDS